MPLVAGILAAVLVACSTPSSFSPEPIPAASLPGTAFVDGSARVTLTAPFGTMTLGDGTCDHAGSDTWLAVNAGDPNGPEYVGVVVGRSPFGQGDAQPVGDGGAVAGSSVLVTWRHGGKGDLIAPGKATARVAADLSSGTFKGTRADGATVSGTFDCLGSGGPGPSAGPSPSPSPSPAASRTPKPTRTPKPSRTPRPSASAQPSPSPAASPVPTAP